MICQGWVTIWRAACSRLIVLITTNTTFTTDTIVTPFEAFTVSKASYAIKVHIAFKGRPASCLIGQRFLNIIAIYINCF